MLCYAVLCSALLSAPAMFCALLLAATQDTLMKVGIKASKGGYL
jgi:hypothetical protein